jgi:DNA-binding transcriptional ArsR family regulator
MNQNSLRCRLIEFTKDDHPFGNVQGKEAFRKLADYVDAHPQTCTFGISLKGIEATDASFPRESVVSIAKQYRGEKGFFLEDMGSRDLIDNWRYAAKAKEQPLVIWNDRAFEIIGPEMNISTKRLVDYVLEKGRISVSEAASDLDMSVQNASTRLKKLFEHGYILRSSTVAESGGIEFLYHAIK